MIQRTLAGAPDCPIWAINCAPGWVINTGDVRRATGVDIPIGSIMEAPLKNDHYSRAIRAAITNAGTTQSKVQLATGIPYGNWNRRMHADTRWTTDELGAIAAHLGITLDELLKSAPEEPPL